MQFTRRSIFSSAFFAGVIITVILASSFAGLFTAAYNRGPAIQTGWIITWNIVTGPANISAKLGGPLVLYDTVSSGTCTLTGMNSTTNSGSSGQCDETGTVVAAGYGVSTCQASFALGASPSFPAAWMAMPTNESELEMFYGVNTLNGRSVQDFRVSSSTVLQPQGFNTGLCSKFLFDGYSADLYVPATAGQFDLGGTPGDFGMFLHYTANVDPIYATGPVQPS